jgi:uncharacterized protein
VAVKKEDALKNGLSRRSFLNGLSGVAAAGLSISPFEALGAREAGATGRHHDEDYGPLAPVRDDSTGLPLLQLPRGFTYQSFGWTGDRIAGARATPPFHDGMAVVDRRRHILALVRNHEDDRSDGAIGSPRITYDRTCTGGTSNVYFDTRSGRFVGQRLSLAGTITNCAGGPTPWGSWLTCEETDLVTGDFGEDEDDQPSQFPLEKDHGFVFEVPGFDIAEAKPLKALGRMEHEAVAVDPVRGFVYLTEDVDDAGFYRFRPRAYGKLDRGGRLQMLKVKGQPNFDFTGDISSRDSFEVEWVDIDDPLAENETTYEQGAAKGGARFIGLEGCWHDSGSIYFTASEGGPAEQGQVFRYDTRRGRVRLLYVSTGISNLSGPDNCTVSPRGGILLCEDGDGADLGIPQRLMGLSRRGQIFEFARNNIILDGERNGIEGDFRFEEWAGPSFSPCGRWLFVNIQVPGITFAITGPWHRGAL